LARDPTASWSLSTSHTPSHASKRRESRESRVVSEVWGTYCEGGCVGVGVGVGIGCLHTHAITHVIQHDTGYYSVPQTRRHSLSAYDRRVPGKLPAHLYEKSVKNRSQREVR
jgi:hypothetical protein